MFSLKINKRGGAFIRHLRVKEIQYLKKLTYLPIYSIILKTTFKQQTHRN